MISIPSKNLTWIPNKKQKQLLDSALLQNGNALISWDSFQENVVLEKADLALQRLFPLIYENLKNSENEHTSSKKLKHFHRKTFVKNQQLISKATEVLNQLNQASIPTIALKGLALSSFYYKSNALRPMADIDILIKKEDFGLVKNVLEANGWKADTKNLPLHFEIAPSCQFINKKDNSELDLHWHIMRDCRNANKTDFLWDQAIPLKIGNQKTFALAPTHQLFHICWHGARYNYIPPIRWVVDATFILRESENEIDWNEFARLAELYRVNIPVYIALKYLKKHYISFIPKKALESLSQIPTNRFQRKTQQFHMTKTTEWTFTRCLKELVFQYQGLASSTDLKPRSLAYLKYLQYHLGVRSYWQIPSKFMTQAFQHFILRQQKAS